MVTVAFRVDASIQIGTGHVMRCLTLANALRERGAQCCFICRPHKGHLLDLIAQFGHKAVALPPLKENLSRDSTTYSEWLGTTWNRDAEDTKQALHSGMASDLLDWLVVDHYTLERQWEKTLRAHARRIMVIDDLADRHHACDLLLDQTFGRDTADYRLLVPADCRLLCGSQYALLRPEFATLRPYSLQRRTQPVLRELLISMGGVDKDNATGEILQALRSSPLPADCRIAVVMGATAPWLEKVRKQAQDMPWPTQVLVGIRDMAQLMADSDLAIGAAGATSWERCCLGVPTIMLVLAENQRTVAQGLERSGAAKLTTLGQSATKQLSKLLMPLIDDPSQLLYMGECAARIVDGSGVNAVMRKIEV